MNYGEKEHAARALVNMRGVIGEGKFIPRVYVVNGRCYWFLNVARRAAFNTNYPIEIMTIEEAWDIWNEMEGKRRILKKEDVSWEFDQTGATFSGNLFCDNHTLLANMVKNRVIING